MRIELRELKPTKEPIALKTEFPQTKEFVDALRWLAYKTGGRPQLLINLAGVAHIKMPFKIAAPFREDEYIYQEHGRETRAWLSYLLMVFGYSEEEIFTEVFDGDFAWRHRPYHQQFKTYRYYDQQILKRMWAGRKIAEDLLSSGKAHSVREAVERFNAEHPDLAQNIEPMTTYVRKFYAPNEGWLPFLRQQRWGDWIVNTQDTFQTQGHNWFASCRCARCGNREFISRARLLEGNARQCPECLRRRKQRRRQRQIDQREHQLLFDVATGRRFKSVKAAYREFKLEGSITYNQFWKLLDREQRIQVGEHRFVLMTIQMFYKRLYVKHLASLGLPDDYRIPNDPEGHARCIASRLRKLAKERRLKQTERYKKQEQKRRLSLSLAEREPGFWSIDNIKEHRKLFEARRPQVLAKVRQEDELLSSHL